MSDCKPFLKKVEYGIIKCAGVYFDTYKHEDMGVNKKFCFTKLSFSRMAGKVTIN